MGLVPHHCLDTNIWQPALEQTMGITTPSTRTAKAALLRRTAFTAGYGERYASLKEYTC